MPRTKIKRSVGRPLSLSPAQVAQVRAWADANRGPGGKPMTSIISAVQASSSVSDTTVRNTVKVRWSELRQKFAGVLDFPGKESVQTLFDFLRSASRTIHVYVYKFTSMRLLKILAEARERNIRVYVIVDGKETPAETIMALRAARITVKTAISKCAHRKMLVIDKEAGLNGSMNWTEAGLTTNEETLTFVSRNDAKRLYKIIQRELTRKRVSK